MFIQLGYILMFSAAFQLAPLLALINNIAELQVDRAKVVHFTRRPFPDGATGIGVWQTFLYCGSYLNILCTWGIVCFTDHSFGDYHTGGVTSYVMLCLTSIVLKVCVDTFVPDIPGSVVMISKRHQMVISKTFKPTLKDE